MSTLQALMDAARDGEPDRLAAALLAPEPQRQALLALAAFSAELRRIPNAVKEPMMGEVRLQWWRDAIRNVTPTGNPIADALLEAMTSYALPPALLIAMTEARAFDLYADPMPDDAALHGYLGKTEGILFELAVRVMGKSPDHKDLAAITAAGRAYGLARLTADLPLWFARGRNPIPVSELGAAGMTDQDVCTGDAKNKIPTLIAALKRDISATHEVARQHVVTLSRQERLPFLPLAVVRSYLNRITTPSRAPLRDPVTLVPMVRMIRIAAAWGLGRF